MSENAERTEWSKLRQVVTWTQYRGTETAAVVQDGAAEQRVLTSGVAVCDRGWRRRVRVAGEDRERWLSGMVTNTVVDLADGAGAWNLVLTAQGRIVGDVEIWRNGAELELELDGDQQQKTLEHLDRFIIMDDVELQPVSGQAALGMVGPGAAALLGGLGLTVPDEPLRQAASSWDGSAVLVRRGYEELAAQFTVWIAAERLAALSAALEAAGAVAVGTEALEALRVAEGVPAYGVDMVERDLPQETGQMRTLHFNKGCYQGQEIVERIRSRGNVHRHLRRVELSGAVAAGTEIFYQKADGTPASAGQLTSVSSLETGAGQRWFGLAVVKAEAEIRPQELTFETAGITGTARVLATTPTL